MGRLLLGLGALRFAARPALVAVGLLFALIPLTSDATTGAVAKSPTIRIVQMGGVCTGFFCYEPQSIKVHSGTTVKWINKTNSVHTVTRCTPANCGGVGGGTGTDNAPNSPVLQPGASYSFKFVGKGTYIYYCQIHGYGVMHARLVIVT